MTDNSQIPPPVEQSFDSGATFAPSEVELAFLQKHTGIQDVEELRQHVLAVQQKALKVCRILSDNMILTMALV